MKNRIKENKFSKMTVKRRSATNINNKTIDIKNPIKQPINSVIVTLPKSSKYKPKIKYQQIKQYMEKPKKDEKNKNDEEVNLINKINSKYILECIFNYIKKKNYKYKLFLYSKQCQKILDINLIELQKKEEYLKEIGFDLDKYIYIESESFQKNILDKNYKSFLNDNKILRYNLEKIIYYIYNNKYIKEIDEENSDKIMENYGKLININSPLFNLLSKTKNFDKYFTIVLYQKNSSYWLQKLNNKKLKYLSIYNILDELNIDYLKKLNFNNIKSLTLKYEYYYNKEKYIYSIRKNNNCFFETLFSLNNIENNLTYLKIDFIYKYSDDRHEIDSNLFEKINDFKSLKYLFIHSFKFVGNFNLKLNRLRLLSIYNCENINISQNFQNLEILNLNKFDLPNINLII